MLERIKRRLISMGAWKTRPIGGKSCIIMYHGIDQRERMDLNLRFFSQSNFERQVAFFKREYNVLHLSDLCDGRGLRRDRLNVAITFDDGYRNNLTYALPVLEKHECPATFFITGLNTIGEDILWADLLDICGPRIQAPSIVFNGLEFERGTQGRFPELRSHIRNSCFMGTDTAIELKDTLLRLSGVDLSDPDLQDYFRLMTDDEIREVSHSHWVRVGSHGMFHNNLGRMSLAAGMDELERSKDYLERVTGRTIDSVGYPDGSYAPELARAAFDLGYRYQCAVDYQQPTDSASGYLHDRIGLYPTISLPTMHHQIASFSK
ncbi:MAG: polysaccharide deacetylase family protein [Flavobacteriales bacterium]|nr:polysaccharide deacetylase family protein [Flavobacteriales bacterium]HRH69024.1 polysaccharide deacetylase family protein [Flavobacteriales bacterium]